MKRDREDYAVTPERRFFLHRPIRSRFLSRPDLAGEMKQSHPRPGTRILPRESYPALSLPRNPLIYVGSPPLRAPQEIPGPCSTPCPMRHMPIAIALATAFACSLLTSCGDSGGEPPTIAEPSAAESGPDLELSPGKAALPVPEESEPTSIPPAKSAPEPELAKPTPAEPSPAPKPEALATQDFTPLLPIEIETVEPRWRETDRQAPRRVALVVGANQAKSERGFALEAAGPAVRELERVFKRLKYDEVISLTGMDVRGDLIESKIELLTRDMTAPGNQLLVAWVGHGYVSKSVQELATYDSFWLDGQDGAPGRLASPLVYDDLLGWVHQSQDRVRKAGGELTTAMVIDACRVGTQSIGDYSLTVNERYADLQLFSAGRGKEAFVNTDLGLPYFTSEVCKQIERAFQPQGGQAGRNLVDLKASLDRALESSKKLRDQEPAWVGRKGLDRFLLYDPKYLSLTVRAVDGITGSPIDDATLTFQGDKKAGALGTFGGRIPSEEGYQLQVHAPGYFGHSQTVWVEQVETAMESGQVLDVPLTRAFIAVEGSVEIVGRNSDLVRVSLAGLDSPIVPVTLTGGGRYRLQTPITSDACDLVVSVGSRELFREPLSLKALTAPRRVDDYDVEVYVREPLRLSLDSTTQVGAGKSEMRIGSVDLAFDFDSLSEDDFLTDWHIYDRVRRYANKKDFEIARGTLKRLSDGENVVDSAQDRFSKLQRELDLSVALEAASKLQTEAREQRGAGDDRLARETMDGAIDLLAKPSLVMDDRIHPVVTSWLNVSAENWHSFEDHERALGQIDRLEALEYDPASLADQRHIIVADWIRVSFRESLNDGDWARTRGILQKARILQLDDTQLAEWQARIDRESISPACRAAFARGKEHHAAGERELARSAYIQAIADSSVTDGYRNTIIPLVRRLERELYQQYESIAFEKEEDDPLGALRAYLEIVNLQPSLELPIDVLLSRNLGLTAMEGLTSYRVYEPWRRCVDETRRLLAKGQASDAFDRVVDAIEAGSFEVETAEFLCAQAVVMATGNQRARMIKVQLAWEQEASKALSSAQGALAEGDFGVAESQLKKANRLPRADRDEIIKLTEDLRLARDAALAAASKKEAEEIAESNRALDKAEAAIAEKRLEAAARDLGRARSLPRVDSTRIRRLELALASAEEKSKVNVDVFKDRAAYSRLGKAEVESLAEAAKAKWRTELSKFQLKGVERFQAGGQSHWMSIWRHGKTGLEFVLVPGGRFQMGSPSDEEGDDDEKQNWVTLDPFMISRTECTQGAWSKVAGSAGLDSSPSKFEGSSELPVETVSWMDVDKWCTEARLDLPTEAQWEFACRAGTTTAFTYGSELSSGNAIFDKSWDHGPVESGSFKPNAFGLFDVHGNVWEWCRDWYLDYDNRVGTSSGLRQGTSANRVYRGGGVGSNAWIARSAYRNRLEPGHRAWNLGFRPSLDLPF